MCIKTLNSRQRRNMQREQENSNEPSAETANPLVAEPQNPQNEVLAAIGQLTNLISTFIQNQNAAAQSPTPAANVQGSAPMQPTPPMAQSHNTQLPSPPPFRPYRSTLPDFIKSNRYFDGAFGKPDEAEDWLAQIERSFAAFEVPPHLQLDYGTYMIRFNARVWWESKRRELPTPATWQMFRHEFLENYFPGSLRVQYSADFLHISQRGRTVEQYETEFSRLLQYAPESYKHSEELKRQVFLNGLDEELRIRLEEFDIRTFHQLVERARIIEGAKKRKARVPEKKTFVFGKKPFEASSSGYNPKRFKSAGMGETANPL